jgi:hypothetical protein
VPTEVEHRRRNGVGRLAPVSGCSLDRDGDALGLGLRTRILV